MKTRVIEYTHEYDEPDWELNNDKLLSFSDRKEDFIAHVTETYYAHKGPSGTRTNRAGDTEVEDFWSGWKIMDSNLGVYGEHDIDGYIGLLEKIREEIKAEKRITEALENGES